MKKRKLKSSKDKIVNIKVKQSTIDKAGGISKLKELIYKDLEIWDSMPECFWD